MYTLIRGAHSRETSTTPSYNDLLLDERANRANMERMDLCGDEVNSSDESLCSSPTSVVPTLIVSPKRGKQRQPKITGKCRCLIIISVFNRSEPMTVKNNSHVKFLFFPFLFSNKLFFIIQSSAERIYHLFSDLICC